MHLSDILIIVLSVLVAYYAVVLLGLVAGFLRLRQASFTGKPFVSVIVAARNEEAHIAGLLDCLLRQDYPNFEIIIVNDRSSDATRTLIEKHQTGNSLIRIIDIITPSNHLPAKKNALAQGIAASKGEILAFTDADCLPPPLWLSVLVRGFEDNVGLVAGYSPYRQESDHGHLSNGFAAILLRKFIQYEEFKGATWSAGSIGLGLGWLCTGRSLAYRRSVYDEVGGFEKIKHSVSGDDDLFMQVVRRETSWHLGYVTAPESYVPTYFPDSFREFVEQRIRHFSAGKFFTWKMKVFFSVFHGANLVILISFLGALLSGNYGILFWSYIIKSGFDSLLFMTAAPKLREPRFALAYLLLEVVIIFYNSLIGPLGMIRRFEWKPERTR